MKTNLRLIHGAGHWDATDAADMAGCLERHNSACWEDSATLPSHLAFLPAGRPLPVDHAWSL